MIITSRVKIREYYIHIYRSINYYLNDLVSHIIERQDSGVDRDSD